MAPIAVMQHEIPFVATYQTYIHFLSKNATKQERNTVKIRKMQQGGTIRLYRLQLKKTAGSHKETSCHGKFYLFLGLGKKLVQILLCSRNRGNPKVVHQNLQDIGRNERRKCRSKMDVLHPEVEEGQQYAYRLLFIP